MQIITSFANVTHVYRFSYYAIRFNSNFDTVFEFVFKFHAKLYNIINDITVIELSYLLFIFDTERLE